MKLLYTHPNLLIVENIKNLMEKSGFEVLMQNQYAGGGIGELAPIDAWPELWLVESADYNEATKLVEASLHQQSNSWDCQQCGENNDGSFELCWSCRRMRV